MNSRGWYSTLKKPKWSPPSWVFGPVWTVLYLVIAYSFGAVFFSVFMGKFPLILALPFALNLAFNFAFTPIQFGLRNNILAALDILLVFATLCFALMMIWPYQRWVVYANIPYLLWVSFATILQLSITALNRR